MVRSCSHYSRFIFKEEEKRLFCDVLIYWNLSNINLVIIHNKFYSVEEITQSTSENIYLSISTLLVTVYKNTIHRHLYSKICFPWNVFICYFNKAVNQINI